MPPKKKFCDLAPKGGTRRRKVAEAWAVLEQISDGCGEDLILALLSSKHATTCSKLKALKNSLENGQNLEKIMKNIVQLQKVLPVEEKLASLSIVAPLFSLKTLKDNGIQCTKHMWQKARTYSKDIHNGIIVEKPPGKNPSALSKEVDHSIEAFLVKNSREASNRTLKRKAPSGEMELVPVRYMEKPQLQLYLDYKHTHSSTICLSSFYNKIPPHYKKARRETGKCFSDLYHL